MSWDPAWERVFRAHDWGRYPPEELIRFVSRGYGGAPDRGAVRILELGCGTGANLWYLAREGFSATGIDGSETAVAKARERLAGEQLEAEILHGDFSDFRELVAPDSFDAVIDIGGVQSNRLATVAAAFDQALGVLRPGGRLFAMLVAAGSWGDGLGVELEHGTFTDIAEGPLAGTGVCHFFELAEVEHLLARYADVDIEYSERSLDARRRTYRHWVVTAARPG